MTILLPAVFAPFQWTTFFSQIAFFVIQTIAMKQDAVQVGKAQICILLHNFHVLFPLPFLVGFYIYLDTIILI
jgi:hypothetical protein